jgi:hypothetical protein
MNTVGKPMPRHERLVVISVAIAAMAGIAAGFFILPSRTTATDYVYLLGEAALMAEESDR